MHLSLRARNLAFYSHRFPWQPHYFEHNSNPARLRRTGSTTVCSFIQEGILYLKPACSLERSSKKKTTNNEQNQPSMPQSLTRQLKCEPAGTMSLSHKFRILHPSLEAIRCDLPNSVASAFILNCSIITAHLPSSLQCILQKHQSSW